MSLLQHNVGIPTVTGLVEDLVQSSKLYILNLFKKITK